MNQGLIPRRYAKALFMLAGEKECDKVVYDAMLRLMTAFVAAPDMQKAMANPYIAVSDKLQLVVAAAQPDKKAETLLTDMVRLMAQNNRLDYVRDMALAYVALYREAHKIYRVDIASATPLQPAELKRIHTIVKNHLPAAATAEFSESVNADLIGGFTVAIDNELLDASVANDLKQLRLKLLSH